MSSNTDGPETYELGVICDGRPIRGTLEPSHPERRAYCARLEFLPQGYVNPMTPWQKPQAEALWIAHPYSRRHWQALGREQGAPADEPVTQQMIADDGRVLDVEALTVEGRTLGEFGAHVKVTLGCSYCGLDYQWRMDVLAPYLDTLRHAGWEEVSLSALGAILST